MKEYTHRYYLTAGECDAQQCMPIPLVARRVIEVATEHANSWGVGYARLIQNNEAWVLSRLTIELSSYPGINSDYSLTTWVEGFNRHFSERNMELTDGAGHPFGYVRSIWVAINIDTRQAASLDGLDAIARNVSDKPCPIQKQGRLRPVTAPSATGTYKFRFCDIDFNRHVNTVRYIELILDQWSMEHYDRFEISRFEIAFLRETHFGTEVTVSISDDAQDTHTVEISDENGAVCRAKVAFRKRNTIKQS